MITIPLEDWVFGVCALLGGVLLLLTVVFDDIIGGLLDGIGVEIGGASVTPILLGFIGMFGAGGLFATQVLGLHGAGAAIVGVVSGFAGAAIAGTLFSVLKRSESAEPFSIADLVGQSAYVSVAIPANHYGSVLVKAEGQTHEFSATSERDVAAGRTVTITGTAGNGVIVSDEAAPASPSTPREG